MSAETGINLFGHHIIHWLDDRFSYIMPAALVLIGIILAFVFLDIRQKP